jgi:hypothetical protein
MTLKADIKYKSNWQQGTLKGIVSSFRPSFTCLLITLEKTQLNAETNGSAP